MDQRFYEYSGFTGISMQKSDSKNEANLSKVKCVVVEILEAGSISTVIFEL